jgi:hypothetical protein
MRIEWCSPTDVKDFSLSRDPPPINFILKSPNIEVSPRNEADPPMRIPVRIETIKQETPTVKSFELDLGGQEFSFLPGQWIDCYAEVDGRHLLADRRRDDRDRRSILGG